MNSETKSLQETIDSLCNSLSDDQVERRDQWIKGQPNPNRRREPSQIARINGKIRIGYSKQRPRLNPSELPPGDLDQLTRRWIQKVELPSILKNGELQIEAQTDFTASRHLVDSGSITSTMRINPEDKTIEFWSSATARRMKQAPLFTIIAVLLLPPGAKKTDRREVEVWGQQIKSPITANALATQIVNTPQLMDELTNGNGNFIEKAIERFHSELKTTANKNDQSVDFTFLTLHRACRDVAKIARDSGD